MSLYQVDEKLVKKEIAKLKPISYTPFRWWRNFKQDIPKNNGSPALNLSLSEPLFLGKDLKQVNMNLVHIIGWLN